MKIALVLHSMGGGGAERVSAALANAWSEQGHKVSLITFSGKEIDKYVLADSIERIVLGLSGESIGTFDAIRSNIQRILSLRRAVIQLMPDVVVGMMTGAAVSSILATRGLKIPVIVSERVHPPCFPLGSFWEWLRWVTYSLADGVVMQTKDSLDWLRNSIPLARGGVIPNPVVYPLPNSEPVLLVADHAQVNRKLLLAVGRLDPQKGFDWLLEAFSRLAIRHADWDLVILGEGTERENLEGFINRLGLNGRVRMPGRCGNAGDWYERANLYVMSSRFEGFPNTLAEAMAHGCAAVSYDCDTGPRDIIRNEVDGLLVRPVGDVSALAEALDKLMGNDPLRKDMRIRAIEVRERFSPERILGLWESIMPNNN
jgi:glycosyltransferase involved in cell wall biosynthesis